MLGLYLHLRITFRFKGRSSAGVLIVVFAVALVTFFGLPFVSETIHQGLECGEGRGAEEQRGSRGAGENVGAATVRKRRGRRTRQEEDYGQVLENHHDVVYFARPQMKLL